MAMNFLQLVNRTRRECGAASSDLATLQGSLILDDVRFKDWVADAWLEVQRQRRDWQWMRQDFSFPTVAGVNAYTPAAAGAPDMADWKRDSMRCYTTSVGTNDEQVLPFMEYGTWRNVYGFGSMRAATGRPAVFSVAPDKSLRLGNLPDKVYTVVGEYYTVPSELVADTDTPTLPSRYEMVIVWRAARHYAGFEAAADVMMRAERGDKSITNQLLTDQLPVLVSGPPLA